MYDDGVIRILPIIFLIILVGGGLAYFRFFAIKSESSKLTTSSAADLGPVEVPKTLPNATLEDRVQLLEKALTEVIKKVNTISTQTDSNLATRVSAVEASITDLKVQIANLPAASSAPAASSSKSTIYIPLGSGGGPWGNTDWFTLNDYQVSLDPANFPGYSGMVLEVVYRMVESAGTSSVRLYNKTDSSVTSSEISNTATSFTLYSTSSFKLSSGTKTYTLQVKSTQGKDVFIQTARIRVNF